MITNSTYAVQAAQFSIRSSSFSDRKDIPVLYTCDGGDRSPQLTWQGAPAKTVSYVLMCDDPDAPAGVWFHWILYNIPSTVREIPSGNGTVPGALLGKNSWGRLQYNGPCPPSSSIHRYRFILYSLDTRLPLAGGADAKTILNAMQGHILGATAITGVFGH